VHLKVIGGNRAGAAWGLPAAPACAVPDTADRPLPFAAQAEHAISRALFEDTKALEWGRPRPRRCELQTLSGGRQAGVAPSAISIRCRSGAFTRRQNTDNNQMRRAGVGDRRSTAKDLRRMRRVNLPATEFGSD